MSQERQRESFVSLIPMILIIVILISNLVLYVTTGASWLNEAQTLFLVELLFDDRDRLADAYAQIVNKLKNKDKTKI